MRGVSRLLKSVGAEDDKNLDLCYDLCTQVYGSASY